MRYRETSPSRHVPFRGNGCGPGTELLTRLKPSDRAPLTRGLRHLSESSTPLWNCWPSARLCSGCGAYIANGKTSSTRFSSAASSGRPTCTARRSARYCDSEDAPAARHRCSSRSATMRGGRTMTTFRSPLEFRGMKPILLARALFLFQARRKLRDVFVIRLRSQTRSPYRGPVPHGGNYRAPEVAAGISIDHGGDLVGRG